MTEAEFFNELEFVEWPEFECNIKDWHDENEWVLVDDYVYDFRAAAESAAREHFWRDPSNPHDFEIEVRIRRKGETEFSTFKITAEPDVNFYAEEL